VDLLQDVIHLSQSDLQNLHACIELKTRLSNKGLKSIRIRRPTSGLNTRRLIKITTQRVDGDLKMTAHYYNPSADQVNACGYLIIKI
jgi:hypothetical protein